MQYGLPYKGSKSKIALEIIEQLPPGRVLYDLFAGGCAITHAALLSGKWDRIVSNDIKPYPGLFRDAALGRYHADYRWVSRDDFFKSEDPFDRLIFSFGNDLRTYIYAAGDVENWKKALHFSICFGDYKPFKDLTGKDLSFLEGESDMEKRRLRAYRFLGGRDYNIHLENLERLGRLQNLERLGRLQNLERLDVRLGSYKDVEIEPGAVIYCDIPYRQTNGYGAKKISDFDYDSFYDWAKRQTAPVYISEYQMPDDFKCVWSRKVNSKMDAFSARHAVEKLYVNIGNANYSMQTLF